MSYDMQVNSKANFHNALYYSSGKTYIAIENSYQNYTQYVDSHKIIIGIPFYARYWTNSSGLNTAAMVHYIQDTSYLILKMSILMKNAKYHIIMIHQQASLLPTIIQHQSKSKQNMSMIKA